MMLGIIIFVVVADDDRTSPSTASMGTFNGIEDSTRVETNGMIRKYGRGVMKLIACQARKRKPLDSSRQYAMSKERSVAHCFVVFSVLGDTNRHWRQVRQSYSLLDTRLCQLHQHVVAR